MLHKCFSWPRIPHFRLIPINFLNSHTHPPHSSISPGSCSPAGVVSPSLTRDSTSACFHQSTWLFAHPNKPLSHPNLCLSCFRGGPRAALVQYVRQCGHTPKTSKVVKTQEGLLVRGGSGRWDEKQIRRSRKASSRAEAKLKSKAEKQS